MNLESHAKCGHPMLQKEYERKKKAEAQEAKLASDNEALKQKAHRLEMELAMMKEREYYEKKKQRDEEEYQQRRAMTMMGGAGRLGYLTATTAGYYN